MSSNKILIWFNSDLLKIWILHVLIYYPICGFLEDNLVRNTLILKDEFNTGFLEGAMLYPLLGIFGLYDGFPFFGFMTFTISFLLKFVLRERFFINYIVSLIFSYLIVYLIVIFVNNYNRNPYYFIIPSLGVTLIIQMLIFRKDIFKNSSIQNKL